MKYLLLLVLVCPSYVQAECADSRKHRVLCRQEKPNHIVMTCEKWSMLVHNAKSLGPKRALIVFANYIKGRGRGEQHYLMQFAKDASSFVMENNFDNPEHAQMKAMQVCGVLVGS